MEQGDDVSALDRLEEVPSDDEREEAVPDEDEEGEGEDLLDENMGADYRAIEHLDRYEAEGLDEDAEEVLDEEDQVAARFAAERELDERQGRAGGYLPRALEEDPDDSQYFRDRRDRRRRRAHSPAPEEVEDEPDVDIDLNHSKGNLAEWVALPAVERKIRRLFSNFLLSYEDAEQNKVYRQRISDMKSEGRRSLEVLYGNMSLSREVEVLASYLADEPSSMLKILNKGLEDAVKRCFPDPDDEDEVREGMQEGARYSVRIAGLPIDDLLRDLRAFHLNSLVRVRGVVTRRTGVFPQLKLVMFDCVKCGHVLGPFSQNTEREVKPQHCPNCEGKGPFNINSSQTVYQDYQKLTLQESPGTVPAGRLPRQKQVILLNDLIDCARPGEEIEVTGIYLHSYDSGLNVKNGFPVFSTCLEANHIKKREDVYSLTAISDEDRAHIELLGKDPAIGQKIVKSIAPSIYGHEFIKTALAMALFGGQEKENKGMRLRGDINVLLLGDPGVAKSQFLKYVEKTASRAVFTTGKGASAVGLTASVHRDALTKEWVLEGGALVLADKGVCLIDEFDKMNDQDRVSIHEAMEQQTISISKAGIVTQLQARCSVIAAANPVGGRYDPSRTLAENVELTDPILSRFDCMCVVRDQVDPVQDQRLAEFVVGNHQRAHPSYAAGGEGQPGPAAQDGILSQDLLRKYITYTKQNFKPAMTAEHGARLLEVYSNLRQEAARTHGMPVAVRHLESIVRMSEAHARMHMRSTVSDEDINVAIKQMLGSFIQSQKYSVHKTLERRFKRFLTFGSDYHQLLLQQLTTLLQNRRRDAASGLLRDRAGQELSEQEVNTVPKSEFEEEATRLEITTLEDFYASRLFTSNGFELRGNGIVYKA